MNIIVSIITAAVTAILTTIIKSYVDDWNYQKKLQKDLDFEQQSKVKTTISKYKGQLINALDSLHNRLKFLARPEGQEMLNSGTAEEKYDIRMSTLYRFLSSFAWIQKINDELIHFDPTKAHEDDLIMMKFFRVFPHVFQDKEMEEGMTNAGNPDSLILRNTFEETYKCMLNDKGVDSYTEFLKNYPKNKSQIEAVEKYFTDFKPSEESTRWERVYTFHLLIMGFLNKFGYDFQQTEEKKIKEYIERQGQYGMFKNMDEHLISRYKLNELNEVRSIMRIVEDYS